MTELPVIRLPMLLTIYNRFAGLAAIAASPVEKTKNE